MSLIRLIAALSLALPITFILLVATALAVGTDGQVVVPWGDWVSSLLTILNALPWGAIVSAAFVAILVKVGIPQGTAQMISVMLTEQLLDKALAYGMNAVQGAVKGKTLSVPVANQVIEESAQYAVDHGPAWLVDWLGGIEGIKARIIARLPLPESAQVSGSTVLGPGPIV